MLPATSYTIADMICYPWTVGWKSQGQDIAEFRYSSSAGSTNFRLAPAYGRGMAVGTDLGEDPATLSDEEKARRRALLYNQRARPAPA